jgi:hypothetical protein
MSETSAYIECERNAWSILRHCEMRFHLTYQREFLPVQAVWRDFLVNSEEMGPAFPSQFAAAIAGVS